MYVQELRNKCQKYKDKYGIGLVIIDYLQLLSWQSSSKVFSREEKIPNIIYDLKQLADELNIPMIICSHLSRNALYRKVPVLSDIKFDTKYIDEIIFILDKEEYHGLNKELIVVLNQELIVVQKEGLLKRVKLKWLPEYLKYIYQPTKRPE